ncbi:MAG: DUF2065 domain-containing protein [Pseudomonadota bacterium]|nr:DUF2065 domain-containing protein [Pseudomonadota bacterium]
MGPDLAAALCLVLVLEGILPFVAPARWQHALRTLAGWAPHKVRLVGLASMIAGALLLSLVKR